MHCSKCKSTPYPSFRQRLLPVRARHDRVRRLLLIRPKGLHHIGAGVLGMSGVEEKLEDEKARDRGDERVEEEEVGECGREIG